MSEPTGSPVSEGPGFSHTDLVSSTLAAHLSFSSALEGDFWMSEVSLYLHSLVLNY